MNSLLRLSSRCCRRNNHVTSKTSLQTQNSTRIVGGRLLSEDTISQHGALFSTSCYVRNQERALSKREMIRQLRDEIRLESESQKLKTGLPSVPGFDISIDGSLLILTKDGDKETVKISVDVIHSLGREDIFNEEGNLDESAEPVFVARPNFQVDFQRETSTLAFRCSFVEEMFEGEEDEFVLEQFFTHDGTTNPTQYVALGRQTNPELYDRLMNMLAERGIDSEFARSLQELATAHEHRCYIRTLKGITEYIAS